MGSLLELEEDTKGETRRDGGIGSMDGALSEPYLFGKPNNYGALVQDDDKFRLEQFQAVTNRGW